MTRLAALLLCCTLGCAGFGRFSKDLGEYTWADDLPAQAAPPDGEYVLGPGDVLQVKVFNQEQLATRTRIRSDGRISLPLLNDVMAAGSTPKALGADLGRQLRPFINEPNVTVLVEEPRQVSIAVLGEVTRPGIYNFEPGSGVLQALASAGGVTDFGHRDRVFVLRKSAQPARVRFDVDKMVLKPGPALQYRLQAGDSVVVE